jgi:F-type H+-transporting ATPase subunit epsilon
VAELTVALVSAERAIWQGTAKSIVAKTPDGEIGILPGHSPVLALLLDAPLRIETTDGTKVLVAVHGGFFSVDSDQVNVIAETAELAEEIDVERAKAALERAKAAASSEDDPEAQAAKRAETRLAVAVGR